jgi:release factor glutamine methyltransferase
MSLSITENALATATIRLRAAGCVFAEEEAAVLREAAPDDATLDAFVERRAQGEPLEQVVGYADFAGIRVRLRPGVFVPRVRSRLLVDLATAHHPDVLLDLCCGSGALGLAVRHRLPGLELHAADLDPAATACARDNGVPHVYQGNLFDPLPRHLRVDVLVANVPYVATADIPFLPAEARDHEPLTALDGGPDGLDIFRRVAGSAPKWLSATGILLSEITGAQERGAIEALRKSGLDGEVITDEDLDARVIRARKV